jgi:hypothetical protein
MSIRDLTTQIKAQALVVVGDWGMPVLILLIGIACFGLGRLSGIESVRTQVSLAQAPEIAGFAALHEGGVYYASSKTMKYYYPWCADVQGIAPENFVIFKNQGDAENAGYSPAPNCKGLK